MRILQKLSAILAHLRLPGVTRCCACGRPAANHYLPWGVSACDEHVARLVPVLAMDARLHLGRAPLVSLN